MRSYFWFSCFWFGLSFNGYSKEILSLRADPWCPYNCEPDSKDPGFLVEIIKKIFEPKDQINYEKMNWTRSIKEATEGKIDGLIGTSKEDAPSFFFPEEPLAKSANCFYIKKENNWKFQETDSFLSDKLLGAVQDYAYQEILNKYIATNKSNSKKIVFATGENPLEENISKLEKNRIQVFVEDQAVYNYYLKNQSIKSDIKKIACLPTADIYVAFSPKIKNGKEYAKTLSDGLKILKKSGEYQKLLKKYSM